MVSMLVRFFLTILMILFPINQPKRIYFICTVLQILAFGIFVFAHYVPSWSHLLFMVGMIILGIGRSIHALPYFITYYNINGAEHPTLISMWMNLNLAGNAWGTLLSLLFVYGFGWSWMGNLIAYALIYLLIGIVFHIVMDEVYVGDEQRNSPSESFAKIKQHYSRQTSNWLLLV